jgi:hypothetical protein
MPSETIIEHDDYRLTVQWGKKGHHSYPEPLLTTQRRQPDAGQEWVQDGLGWILTAETLTKLARVLARANRQAYGNPTQDGALADGNTAPVVRVERDGVYVNDEAMPCIVAAEPIEVTYVPDSAGEKHVRLTLITWGPVILDGRLDTERGTNRVVVTDKATERTPAEKAMDRIGVSATDLGRLR